MEHIKTLETILDNKIDHSLRVIRLAAEMSEQYYDAPLIITYSGGKDSDVLVDLAVRSGASVEFEHSLTTVDAPETVNHVKEVFKRLEDKGYKTTIHRPDISMWRLIEKKLMPPTRIVRYCCGELKESTTPNRYVATGVRGGGESRQRGSRMEFETLGSSKSKSRGYTLEHVEEVYEEAQGDLPDSWDCQFITFAKKHKDLICNPIFAWTDSEVWEYIRKRGIDYNPLYDRGYFRVGCIGCPMARYNERTKEFTDYPKYKDAYIRAFDRMIENRKKKGKDTKWKNGQEVFDWWMENPQIDGQLSFEDVLRGDTDE